MKKYAEILTELQRKICFCMGENVGISYPMPDVVNSIRVERMFLNRTTTALIRNRPFALLTVSMENGTPLDYQDCRFQDFMDSGKYSFDQKINYALPRKQGVKEYATKQALLRKLYEMVRQLAFRETLSQPERELVSKYCVLLQEQVPADLLDYYHKTGENFYRWVKKNV